MTPANFSGPLLVQGNAIFPGSKTISLMAVPMSLALSLWISNPLSVQIFGATSGVAGAGNVTGSILGVVGVGIMLPALQAAGLNGSTSPSMALLVEQAVRTALIGALYQGASAGVGSGTDAIVKVVANGPALTALFQSTFAAAGLTGLLTPQLSLGLGQGVAGLVATCVGTGAVTGPGNIPAVGTSLSRFI